MWWCGEWLSRVFPRAPFPNSESVYTGEICAWACLLVPSLSAFALEQWKRRRRCCPGFRAIWCRHSHAEVVASRGRGLSRPLRVCFSPLCGALRQDRRATSSPRCVSPVFLVGLAFLPRWVGRSCFPRLLPLSKPTLASLLHFVPGFWDFLPNVSREKEEDKMGALGYFFFFFLPAEGRGLGFIFFPLPIPR